MVNKAFAAHVRSASFALTLSRNMIFQLWHIAGNTIPIDRKDFPEGMYDTSVPTRQRLAARGLVCAPHPEWPGYYELTRAGELVFELLKEAGYYETNASREVRSAESGETTADLHATEV